MNYELLLKLFKSIKLRQIQCEYLGLVQIRVTPLSANIVLVLSAAVLVLVIDDFVHCYVEYEYEYENTHLAWIPTAPH